jgi:hypothetical protein
MDSIETKKWCGQLTRTLATAEDAWGRLDRSLVEATRNGILGQVRVRATYCEQRLQALQDVLETACAEILDLNKQYREQHSLLFNSGILERWGDTSERGIVGDDTFYPIPSYEEVRRRCAEQFDVLLQKHSQGFTQMLLVPFGMDLLQLISKIRVYEENFLQSNADALGLDPSKNINCSIESIHLQRHVCLDRIGHRGEFTEKEKLLEQSPSDGWQIVFVQPTDEAPKQPQEVETLQGRPRNALSIVSHKDIKSWLRAVPDDSPSAHESGMTMEEWMMFQFWSFTVRRKLIDTDNFPALLADERITQTGRSTRRNIPVAGWDRSSQEVAIELELPEDTAKNFRTVVRV